MDTKFSLAVKAFIDLYGGQAEAARAIKVKQPTISAWLNNGHGVSARNALKVESVTQGAVKATDLCPDLIVDSNTAA